jgi:hypothetical protein
VSDEHRYHEGSIGDDLAVLQRASNEASALATGKTCEWSVAGQVTRFHMRPADGTVKMALFDAPGRNDEPSMSGCIVVDAGWDRGPQRESPSARRVIECVLAPLSDEEGWDKEERSDTSI